MRQSTSIHTRFEPDTWDGIEAYRRTQDAIPSRSRAVNDLVARALAELQAEAEKRISSRDGGTVSVRRHRHRRG